jgi:hypothetical protein
MLLKITRVQKRKQYHDAEQEELPYLNDKDETGASLTISSIRGWQQEALVQKMMIVTSIRRRQRMESAYQ